MHRQHQFFDDAQTETCRRFAAGRPGGKTAIAAKHPRLIFRGKTGPLVLNLALDISCARLADRDANLLARRGKLYRIGQKIIEHLVEGRGISLNQSAVALENGLKGELFALGRLVMLLDRVSRGEGPCLYVLLDNEGLPKSGVIYDPDTGRREKVRFPIKREVA